MRDKIIMSVLIGIIIGLCIGVFPVIQSGGNFNQKVGTAISKAEGRFTKVLSGDIQDLDKRIGYLETHRHYGK